MRGDWGPGVSRQPRTPPPERSFPTCSAPSARSPIPACSATSSPATSSSPATPAGTRPAGLEPRRRPAPGARRHPALGRGRPGDRRLRRAATACASPPQGTGHNAARDRLARRQRPAPAPRDARRRDRRRPRSAARARAGALWEDVVGRGLRARPDRARRLLARRRRRRLHARRRHRLARPRARPRRQQRHRDRARHRRRRAPSAPTPSNEPELFWALRGGGGSLRRRRRRSSSQLYAVTEVYAGALFFPIERAGEVLHAWREWVRTVPDEVTSVGRMLQLPAAARPPRAVPAGHSFVVVEAACSAPQGGRRAARPAARARPGDRHVRHHRHRRARPPAHGPAGPGAGHRRRQLLADLPPRPIEAALAASGPAVARRCCRWSSATSAGRSPGAPDGGALAGFDGAFALSPWASRRRRHRRRDRRAPVAASSTGSRRGRRGRAYLNFAEHPGAAKQAFDETTIERLRSVRAAYDPEGMFRAAHALDA